MSRSVNRRYFLLGSLSAAASLEAGCARRARTISPNEKLNIGAVGTAGRAAEDINGVLSENIVALCDVDSAYLAEAQAKFPKAAAFDDFRRMLDHPGLDAVVVGTPDHIHAPASIEAMRRGLHVYCEKPLTHSVAEARLMAETARKHGCATQMGTQIHAEPNYRRVVEIIQAGAIGNVTEVFVWVGKGWAGGERPKETPPPPKNLNWDLWLGPAPERPYAAEVYHPKNWRRWWDFGNGTLGDMACHYMDLPFWALGLRHPLTVEASGPPLHAETCPHDLTVRYEYPARGAAPALALTWMDDTLKPKLLKEKGLPEWGSAVLFVGEKGMMLADYTKYALFPEADFKGYAPPAKSIPDSVGHHKEWIDACKTGSATTCNFDYAGALTEAVLLGGVSYRTGKKLEWDAKRLRAANCPEADHFIRKEYRKGWEL